MATFPLIFSQLGIPIVGSPTDVNAAPIVDEVSASVTYIGYGNLGADPAKAQWMILRITKTGTVTITEYASGDMKFDHIWNDRVTLSYAR